MGLLSAAGKGIMVTLPSTTRPLDILPAITQPPAAATNRQEDALVQRLFEEALQLQTQIDLAREEQQKQKEPA